MSSVVITRARIAKALLNEPVLLPGTWVSMTEEFKETCETDYNSDGYYLDQMPKDLKTKDCSVCAVGAVMREILDPHQKLSAISKASSAATIYGNFVGNGALTRYEMRRARKEALDILNSGNPMSALSYLFESLGDYYIMKSPSGKLRLRDIKAIRSAVVDFVEKNFPYKVTIDIDGAKPAKDVKVVKKAKKQ